MVPVETVGVSDEGYTSSPTASQCSSIESRNGTSSQWPLMESPSATAPEWSMITLPSGTGEPLFSRFQGFEDVSVTPVAPAALNAAQIWQKQQKKGKGLGNRKKRVETWRSRSRQDLSFESHGQGTASDHRKVKIPPLPKSFSLMALNQRFYKNPPPIQPEMSREEKNANLIAGMRNEVTFEMAPLIPPIPLPSKVHFLGFTEAGTVMITFLDKRNQEIFEQNQEKIEMWFGHNRFFECDTRIQKDDVFKDRIVLVSIPRRNGGHWNMRAKISDFDDKWIIVDGVDYAMWQRKLSYDNVFYQLKDFNFSPFQLQEVHLEGLEKFEGSPVLQFMIERVTRAVDEWAKEERLQIPDYLVLKKIGKGKKDGYKVRLDFPEEFLDGLSLNKIVMEGMRNFDPFKDYMVTP